ncbi:MAG: O-antigen ligase family protein [Gloeobacterales cyanobacterium]
MSQINPSKDRWSWRIFLIGCATIPVSVVLVLLCWLIALGGELRARKSEKNSESNQAKNAVLAMKVLSLISLGLLVTSLLGYAPLVSLPGLFNYLPFFLFFWLITRLVKTPEQLKQVLLWSLAGGVVAGTVGVLEWVSDKNHELILLNLDHWGTKITLNLGSREPGVLERVTSFFSWPTFAAAYFLLMVPVGMALALSKVSIPARLWSGYSALVSFISLIGTQSRNAWGGVFLAIGALLAYGKRLWSITLLLVAIGLCLGAGFGPPQQSWVQASRMVVPEVIWVKLQDSVDQGTLSYISAQNRVEAWNIAWHMAQARPITGWGLQSYPAVADHVYKKKGDTLHAHNIYLTYFSEMGFPVAFALLGFYGFAFWRGFRAWPRLNTETRWFAIGLGLALGAYFIFGLFDVPFNDARVNAQFWLWLGLLWGLGKENVNPD